MVRYKDGIQAKIGDMVKDGKQIVGELIQIIPSHASCKCLVATVEVIRVDCNLDELGCRVGPLPMNLRRPVGGMLTHPNQPYESVAIVPKISVGNLQDFERVSIAREDAVNECKSAELSTLGLGSTGASRVAWRAPLEGAECHIGREKYRVSGSPEEPQLRRE